MADRALVCLPGLGGSQDEWTAAAHGLGHRRVHTDLPPSGAVILVGHSFGGVEAMRLAALHPRRVDALILTGSFWPPARDERALVTAVADYAGHRAAYVREVAGRGRRPRPTLADARRLARVARLGLRPGAFHRIAGRVTAPVLALHGTLDHVVPIAFARAGARRHAAWTLIEMPGGGHRLHVERPEEWARAVADWAAAARPTPPAR